MLEVQYKKVLDDWFKENKYIILHTWTRGILDQEKMITCLCDSEIYFIRLFLSFDSKVQISIDSNRNLGEIDTSYFEPMAFPEMPDLGL